MHEEFFRLIDRGDLILEEGQKDKAALVSLGFLPENILTLNKPLYQIVEEVSRESRTCIILTDLDKEGRRLYSTLQHHLKRHGVKVDNKLRHFLFRETKLRQIEGLARYLSNHPLNL